eukprot:PhM_4_TR2859/c0_g1_i1/m.31397
MVVHNFSQPIAFPWASEFRKMKGTDKIKFPDNATTVCNIVQGEVNAAAEYVAEVRACTCRRSSSVVASRLERTIETVVGVLQQTVSELEDLKVLYAEQCSQRSCAAEREREAMMLLSERASDLESLLRRRAQKKRSSVEFVSNNNKNNNHRHEDEEDVNGPATSREHRWHSASKRTLKPPHPAGYSPTTVCYMAPHGSSVMRPSTTPTPAGAAALDDDDHDHDVGAPTPVVRGSPAAVVLKKRDYSFLVGPDIPRDKAFINRLLTMLRTWTGDYLVRIKLGVEPERWSSVVADVKNMGATLFFKQMLDDPLHTVISMTDVVYPVDAPRRGKCVKQRPAGLTAQERNRIFVKSTDTTFATRVINFLRGTNDDDYVKVLHPFVTEDIEGAWVQVVYRDVLIMPSTYSLASHCAIGKGHLPRNWRLEATLNGNNRTVLYTHIDDRAIDKDSDFAVWDLVDPHGDMLDEDGEKVPTVAPYRGPFDTFRLVQTGPNILGTNHFQVTAMELYGRVLRVRRVEDDGMDAALMVHEKVGDAIEADSSRSRTLAPLPDMPPALVMETKGKKGKKKKK